MARCSDGLEASTPPSNDGAAEIRRLGKTPSDLLIPRSEQAADAASVPPGGTVVDPFAGCGSAGTFLTARGEAFIGIEAHRLIGELASLKGARVGPPQELRQAAEELREHATASLSHVDLEREDPVVHRSVPCESLSQLVALRDSVGRAGEWGQHLRWLVLDLLRHRPAVAGHTRAALPVGNLSRPAG